MENTSAAAVGSTPAPLITSGACDTANGTARGDAAPAPGVPPPLPAQHVCRGGVHARRPCPRRTSHRGLSTSPLGWSVLKLKSAILAVQRASTRMLGDLTSAVQAAGSGEKSGHKPHSSPGLQAQRFLLNTAGLACSLRRPPATHLGARSAGWRGAGREVRGPPPGPAPGAAAT